MTFSKYISYGKFNIYAQKPKFKTVNSMSGDSQRNDIKFDSTLMSIHSAVNIKPSIGYLQ